jgi:tetratricopeptide (TPR) repeat protein
MNRGQYDEAILDFSKALEINPTLFPPYSNRGLAYSKKGQFEQAISDYSKALEIDPWDASVYDRRGSAYMNRGQYDEAVLDFTKFWRSTRLLRWRIIKSI